MRSLLFPAAVVMAAFAVAAPMIATAQSPARAAVDAALAQGTVGEQADGFLGFVGGGGDAALQTAVRQINDGRRQAYARVAAETGVSPEAAGQATAVRQQARLPAGQYYRTLEGDWRRK